jgi:hypothetical protein
MERGCASLGAVQGSGVSWAEKAVARFSTLNRLPLAA